MMRERESNESGIRMAVDHNWSRREQRSSVQMDGDVSALYYYPEKETGDSMRPAHRVVAIEDLWDTLVGVHSQLSHGGQQRMEKYLIEHGTHVPRPVMQRFVDLCQTCQETRGRKSTHKIIHKPIIPDTVGQRGQADLVNLQMVPDDGYKYILNYQDCFSKFVILRALKTKTAAEVADCLVNIFFEHGPPSLLQTDNGAEFSNKLLMARIKQLWTGTVIVHGRPRHPQDQGSVERANGDFKNMLYARLRDVKKEMNQWVGELPYVQYSKNNAYHSGIRTTPYRVHFGRAPADLSVDMTLPKEVVEQLETEDDLCGVLESRQVIGYASFDPSSDTPIASPNPLPFSHLSLQEPASGVGLGGPVSTFTYDEVPESEYTSSIGMSSQQPPLEEPSILSPPLPSSSLPAETDDNSYDIPVPPLIDSKFTPYFDLATGTTHQVAPALPSVQLHTEASDFSPEDRSDDTQYEEEHQCTSCPDMYLPANCMARVQAFGATGV